MDEERELMKENLNKELRDKQWLTRLAYEVELESIAEKKERAHSRLSISDLDKSQRSRPRLGSIMSSELEKSIRPLDRKATYKTN